MTVYKLNQAKVREPLSPNITYLGLIQHDRMIHVFSIHAFLTFLLVTDSSDADNSVDEDIKTYFNQTYLLGINLYFQKMDFSQQRFRFSTLKGEKDWSDEISSGRELSVYARIASKRMKLEFSKRN